MTKPDEPLDQLLARIRRGLWQVFGLSLFIAVIVLYAVMAWLVVNP